MKNILIFTIALALSMTTFAQKGFSEGVITMKQTMSTDSEMLKATFDEIGELLTTTYVDGTKSRTETSNPMSGDATIIINSETNELLQLMDVPGLGKKYVYQKQEITPEMMEKISVVNGTETKTILGYECKQYTVSIDQDGAKIVMDMFVTDKIKGVATQQTAIYGDRITGFPMYMVMTMNQMGAEIKVTSEVTKMDAKPVDDGKFSMTPPEGYSKM